jgi:hypothetical protein
VYTTLSKWKGTFFILLLCLGMLVTAGDYVYASSLTACNAECQTSSCGGGYKLKNDGNTYVGCKKKWFSSGCKGKCQKCTLSIVDWHCVQNKGYMCYSDTGYPSTSCGTTTYYPCAGGPYPDCTCDDSTPQTSTDSCSVLQCVTGG